jgi:hypothetical protein
MPGLMLSRRLQLILVKNLSGVLLSSCPNLYILDLAVTKTRSIIVCLFISVKEKGFVTLDPEVVFLVVCNPSMNKL